MDHDTSRTTFISKCDGNIGTSRATTEPKLAEMLEDPIVQSLMAADGVDPRLLMVSLCQMSSRFLRHTRNRQSQDFENGSGASDSSDPLVGASPAGDVEKIRALDPPAT
jgi:hypothetical protein